MHRLWRQTSQCAMLDGHCLSQQAFEVIKMLKVVQAANRAMGEDAPSGILDSFSASQASMACVLLAMSRTLCSSASLSFCSLATPRPTSAPRLCIQYRYSSLNIEALTSVSHSCIKQKSSRQQIAASQYSTDVSLSRTCCKSLCVHCRTHMARAVHMSCGRCWCNLLDLEGFVSNHERHQC